MHQRLTVYVSLVELSHFLNSDWLASAYMLGHQSLLELVAADSRAPKHNKHAPDNGSREKKIYIYIYIYI